MKLKDNSLTKLTSWKKLKNWICLIIHSEVVRSYQTSLSTSSSLKILEISAKKIDLWLNKLNFWKSWICLKIVRCFWNMCWRILESCLSVKVYFKSITSESWGSKDATSHSKQFQTLTNYSLFTPTSNTSSFHLATTAQSNYKTSRSTSKNAKNNS